MKYITPRSYFTNSKKIVNHKIALISHSRYLGILTITYSMVLICANLFDPRLINFMGLNTGSGAMIFPFTYLLSDIITEVYGYKNARFAVWVSLFFNLIFILYGQVIINMPSPPNSNNVIFDSFLHLNMRIVFASLISYLITEQINSYVVAKLKILFRGKNIGFRFVMSTLSAHAINAIIFCTVAFYGIISNINLLFFISTSWVFMVSIELFLLPLSIRLSKKLKQIEKLDIYDKRTNFSLFKLDVNYTEKDNEFKKLN